MRKIILMIVVLGSFFNSAKTQCEIGKLMPYKEGAKFGYINRHGKIVIKAKYDEVRSFKKYSDKSFAIVRKGEKYRIIDSHGTLLNKMRYDSINGYNIFQREFLAYRNRKFVNITLLGKEKEGENNYPTCGALFEYLKDKEQYRIAIEKLESGAHVSKLIGESVLKTSVSQEYDSLNKLVFYEVLGERALRRDTITTDYDSLLGWRIDSKDVYLQAWKSGKTGIIKNEGEVVLPLLYDKIQDRSYMSRISYIHKNEKVGIVSDKGEILVKPIFNDIMKTNSYKLCELVGQIIRIQDSTGKVFSYDTIGHKVIRIEGN